MKKFFQPTALLTLLTSMSAPLFAVADANTGISAVNVSYLTNYKENIVWVVNYLFVPALMAVAFIVFLWGVYQYFIQGAANEDSRKTGRQFTLWSIIGFVIILSLWGIVNLFMGTLGLSAGTAPPYPTIGGAPASNYNNNQSGTAFGAPVYGSNGTLLGTVNSSGNIVNSNGQVIGRMSNGQAISNSGTPITGATAGIPEGGNCSNNPEGCVSSAPYCISGVCSTGISNTPVGLGESCSPTVRCYTGLDCNGGVCEQPAGIQSGGDCTYSACMSGLDCNYDDVLGYSICSGGI